MLINLGPVRLSASLIPTIATFAILPLLLWLGTWQLERAAAKSAMLTVFEQRVLAPPIPLDTATNDSRYRAVSASGEYDAQQQILLDNQLHKGRAGYFVYTPLRIPASPHAVLINRGWVPVGESRQRLPDVSIIPGPVDITGRVAQPPSPGIKLEMAADTVQWPLLVQHIDYEKLTRRLGYPLRPLTVQLDPSAAQGFTRDWQINFGTMTPERHHGYAVQWFALAGTLLILYLVMNIRWKP